MMFGHLPDITRALIIQAKSMRPGVVKATEIIFNLTLGRSPEKTTLQPEPEEDPLTPERKEMILRAFRNFNVIPDEEKAQ